MNSVILVSGIRQSDSVIHIYASILFQIFISFRLLHSIEQSSHCYTVGPCCLSILNKVVCTCQSLNFEEVQKDLLSPWHFDSDGNDEKVPTVKNSVGKESMSKDTG